MTIDMFSFVLGVGISLVLIIVIYGTYSIGKKQGEGNDISKKKY